MTVVISFRRIIGFRRLKPTKKRARMGETSERDENINSTSGSSLSTESYISIWSRRKLQLRDRQSFLELRDNQGRRTRERREGKRNSVARRYVRRNLAVESPWLHEEVSTTEPRLKRRVAIHTLENSQRIPADTLIRRRRKGGRGTGVHRIFPLPHVIHFVRPHSCCNALLAIPARIERGGRSARNTRTRRRERRRRRRRRRKPAKSESVEGAEDRARRKGLDVGA